MRRGGAILLALALAMTPVHASAATRKPDPTAVKRQRQREIGQQIATLKTRVAEASAQESALLDELDSLDERIGALSSKVGSLDSRILGAQNELVDAQRRLDDLEGRYRQADAELRNLQRRLRGAKQQLRARAVAAYTEGPALRQYTKAFLDSGIRELAARNGYLDTVVRNQKEIVDRYRLLQEQAADQAEVLEGARGRALSQRDIVAARTEELESARADQDSVRQQVLSETNRRARVLNEVRDRKAEFEQQIASLLAESNTIASFLRARQAGQTIRPSGSGVLAMPVNGPITSGFGSRRHPIFGGYRMHTGVDFGVAWGVPIRSAAAGEVLFAGYRGGYGNTVIVDHGGSLATLYAHQSSILVSTGQQVTRGQVVGKVGSTGYSTGPHLHFETRVSGTPVDPMRYL